MATNMGWLIGPSETSFETDYFEYNNITQESFEFMVFLYNLHNLAVLSKAWLII